jgi:DNA recombination protein RmuC
MTAEVAYAFAMALAAALVATLVAILWMRRSLAPISGSGIQRLQDLEAEVGRLRDAKAEADSRLAAEVRTAGRIPGLEADLDKARGDASDLRAQLAGAKKECEQERKRADEKLKLLIEVRENMEKDFKVLAEEIMSRHGATFSKQNKEQVENLVTPLREKLTEFHQNLQSVHTQSMQDRSALREQIKYLSDQSKQMSTETQNLTRALKGKAPVQGAWGEMVLYTILEKSGLREGEEYERQVNVTAEDGTIRRLDAIVKLPDGLHVIIDSKVSLTAFTEYVNAEAEENRVTTLKQHAISVRNHINSLAAKEYHVAARSELDYVIMFMPIEAALAAAIEADSVLTAFALEKKVPIGTPTTLMVILRTVANLWRVERQNRNAEAIADRAGKLYEKFVGFLDDMQRLGGRLDDAQKYYDGAMNKLKTGNGNVVRQIEQLKEMGAKTSKSIPAALIEQAAMEALPAPGLAAE